MEYSQHVQGVYLCCTVSFWSRQSFFFNKKKREEEVVREGLQAEEQSEEVV